MHNLQHSYKVNNIYEDQKVGITKNSVVSSNGRLGNTHQFSYWKLEKLGKTKIWMLTKQWKIIELWRSKLTQVSLAFGAAFPIGPSADKAIQKFRLEQRLIRKGGQSWSSGSWLWMGQNLSKDELESGTWIQLQNLVPFWIRVIQDR